MLWHTCTRNQQIKNVAINNIIVKLNTPKCTSGGGGGGGSYWLHDDNAHDDFNTYWT